MYELLLAFLLITTPQNNVEYVTPVTASNIILLSLDMEIMDKKEMRWFFVDIAENQKDINYLYSKYDYVKDSPKTTEIGLFPEFSYLRARLQFNLDYREFVENNMYGNTREEVLEEVDFLFNVYDSAMDTQREWYSIVRKREAIKKLHDLIGDDIFTGRLPPCVPIWRFREID